MSNYAIQILRKDNQTETILIHNGELKNCLEQMHKCISYKRILHIWEIGEKVTIPPKYQWGKK